MRVLGLGLLSGAAAGMLAAAEARAEPVLHLPFRCQESWHGRTYRGHSGGGAGESAIDWVDPAGVGTPGGSPGRPVLASAAGTVLPVSPDPRGYGNFVDVDHGGGLVTRYAHLGRIDVSPNQHVEAGTQLGLTGATGAVSHGTYAHLHYEQRLRGIVRRSVFEGSAVFSNTHAQPGELWVSQNCGSVEPAVDPDEIADEIADEFLSMRAPDR